MLTILLRHIFKEYKLCLQANIIENIIMQGHNKKKCDEALSVSMSGQ